MSHIARIITIILLGFLGVEAVSQAAVPKQADPPLPTLVYLGEGPQTFNNEPGWNFIVKRLYPFRFEFVPGPTYTAVTGEFVWASMGTGGSPPAVYHQSVEVGFVQAGCVVSYIGIDDQVDGRINHFTLDGMIIHTMTEGMVTSGKFNVPQAGVLGYVAEDSIGLYIDVCEIEIETPIPPTSRPTLTPTPGGTQTPIVPTPVTILTVTPTMTQTPVGVVGTPTATRRPKKACTRINFEISGDVAREGEYRVVEAGGRLLFVWPAKAGWQDSGWQYDIDISFDAVHVEVYFVPSDGSEHIRMNILNPAPGTPYGWLSSGMCHALEVGWP